MVLSSYLTIQFTTQSINRWDGFPGVLVYAHCFVAGNYIHYNKLADEERSIYLGRTYIIKIYFNRTMYTMLLKKQTALLCETDTIIGMFYIGLSTSCIHVLVIPLSASIQT